MKKTTLPILVLTSLFLTTSQAEGVRPMISISADFGGETVGSTIDFDGDKDNVHANEGIQFSGGLAFQLMDRLQLHTLLGYQLGGSFADNGEMEWSSVPWETTLVASLGDISVGGGVIYHMNPRFETSGVLANLGDYEFDDTLGYQAQVAWAPLRGQESFNYQVGLRYSKVDFESDAAIRSINGDSTGLFFRYLF